jgi:NADPH-dependent 7-cyano-7-deazaguanine reductase QueF-like protein
MTTPHLTPDPSPLGKTVSYQDQYDASLLFPIARSTKRDEIGVDEQSLPFVGVDIWTGFELSWLNARGKPQVGIATFRIPADSPNLIESKSFKLYLNSYNQTRIASLAALQAQLALDLSNAAGGTVRSVCNCRRTLLPSALPNWTATISTSKTSPWTTTRPARTSCMPTAAHRQRNPVQQSAEVQLPGHRPAGLGQRANPLYRPQAGP